MNKVELIGRLTSDPEVRTSQGNDSLMIARFSIAVNRRFKDADGEYSADFIRCVAFGKTAEFLEKYFTKGMAIGITGRIQTGSYTNKDGNKIYTTDVVIEEAEFVEKKGSATENATSTSSKKKSDDAFMDIPDAEIDELPFN